MSSPTNKNPYTNRRERGSGLAWLAVFLSLAVLMGAFLAGRQDIYDWIKLRGYTPPSAIVKLADQDTMNDYTRHLFYLNRPQLLSTVSSFRHYCPENKETIVLGCYHPDQDGIFLYDVQDPKLAGVQQVTAAHEVLHAVYARLSDADRQKLDKQLNDFYEHGLTDPRVKEEVRIYKQTEPNDVMDEMSCTFGTEVAELPPGLEAYYKRYFTNRSEIVAYEQKYEGEFTKRQTLIKQYDVQLESLRNQIDADKADLDGKLADINAEQARLDAYKSSGDTSAYNAGVPEYNRLVAEYNAEISTTKALVDRYNVLVRQRNAVARELADLANSLDTRLTPESTR